MTLSEKDIKAKRYSAIKFRLLIADIFLTVISLLVFYLFLSSPVKEMVTDPGRPFFIECFLFSGVFLAFMYLVSLPLHIFSSFVVEKKFELSERTFISWCTDELKGIALSFVLYMVCLEVFYALLRNFPETWWAIGAVLWIVFSILMARFLPVILLPVFYKYIPVSDESLQERIKDCAKASGVTLKDVSQIDFSKKTKKANAALIGLGKTRRVVLADTLVDEFPNSEVIAVVAHEFGHLKHRHIWQLLLSSGIVTFLGFYLLSLAADKIAVVTGAGTISDITLLPVLILLLAVFSMAILPMQNLFSRILERQADRFALEVTGDKESFIGAMRRLASMNMAEVKPSILKKIFFYDHPPICERLEMAEKWEK